mmetsp:Transcript_55375/g.147845  ORF Transcript_55375/g.147845 Transcript_55375/m.147845 type:complete len:267 (-) Transcript_55375:294-1094(-)
MLSIALHKLLVPRAPIASRAHAALPKRHLASTETREICLTEPPRHPPLTQVTRSMPEESHLLSGALAWHAPAHHVFRPAPVPEHPVPSHTQQHSPRQQLPQRPQRSRPPESKKGNYPSLPALRRSFSTTPRLHRGRQWTQLGSQAEQEKDSKEHVIATTWPAPLQSTRLDHPCAKGSLPTMLWGSSRTAKPAPRAQLNKCCPTLFWKCQVNFHHHQGKSAGSDRCPSQSRHQRKCPPMPSGLNEVHLAKLEGSFCSAPRLLARTAS